jgi:two-component system chemotaxis response regulator CheB
MAAVSVTRDIVVIGASAGGVEALTNLVGALPADLPASLFVVLHVPPFGTSLLPSILSRRRRLPARHPENGEPIQPGRIYVAPPDRHLLVCRGGGLRPRVQVTRGPHEHGYRPAADPLFRSAALFFGPRVVGVVLSGSLDDGTAGLKVIKEHGGVTVAQDPDEAAFSSMPLSAIETVGVDYVLPVAEIAALLAECARTPVEITPQSGGETEKEEDAMADAEEERELEVETEAAAMVPAAMTAEARSGVPSAYSCPDCGGVLWEVDEGALIRFRCRVGHAYSADSLLAEQSDTLDEVLWSALRALEESAALAERLSQRAHQRGQRRAAARFAEQSHGAKSRADVIRQVLSRPEPISDE